MTILKALAWIICVAVGAALIAWGTNPEIIHELDAFSGDKGAKLYSIAVGAFLLLVCLIILLASGREPKQQNIRLIKEKGDIIVNLGSVEDSLIRCGSDDPDIKSLKVDFSGRGKMLRIRVSAIIYEMQNVPTKVEALQELLGNRFNEIMGPLGRDIKIDVVLKKITPRSRRSSNVATVPSLPSSSTTFDGNAEYPTNGEGEDGKPESTDKA